MKEGVVFTLFLIALTSACDTINQLFLKSAINSLAAPSGNILKIAKFILKLVLIPRVWISFLFSIISLCIWLFVLSRADLSFAFSADSMHYVFIAIASRFVLKERVSFKRWLGIFFIIIGITIISFT
ncbi:MAG: 4-amino-4-deoxy-L-arabinose-phosphoundecaprenol flippase subunit ArnF [Candidatus Omnitrophica bacterium ADurb.Bin205]|nr:MAG: 4-amino-4-deoxy-L-arabinose-phosphoundecaprenol flippase subunit ArnF [Candidatus Omnitrophica bacterium ADurb.Bin205]